MSIKIDYFGDFTAELVLFQDRLKYIEEAGVEILSREPYDTTSFPGDPTYLVKLKVNSMTLLQLYSAGCKDGIEKTYKLYKS
jgi:hypothetical protein